MLKHKKLIIIIAAIIFFLTALTIYLNRVVFPQLVRKIAIEQAEKFLNRKVEIEAIHFNWVKGFIIDKVKIYQKDSPTEVLAQTNRISFGVIFIPGVKQHKITIPFVNIDAPSAHLVRLNENTWNFSDLIPAQASQGKIANEEKPSPFAVALGTINITDGKIRVDDISHGSTWTELFDAINLTMSLSYKGINYDFSSYIPQKKGELSAKGFYNPLSGAITTDLRLKNIDTASYLSLAQIKDFNMKSGIINEVDLSIEYTKEKIGAKGNVSVSALDLKLADKSFKGNIRISDLAAAYAKESSSLKGNLALTDSSLTTNGFFASGSWRVGIAHFDMDQDVINFEGDLSADHAYIATDDKHTLKGQLSLESLKLRKSKEGTQLIGAVFGRNLNINWDTQSAQGDITLKPLTIRMSDENHIELSGDLKANNLTAKIGDGQSLNSGNITITDLLLNITNKKDLRATAKLNLDDISLSSKENTQVLTSLKSPRFQLKFADDILKVSTESIFNTTQITLDKTKTISASPRLEINLTLPLKDLTAMQYDGSITVSDLQITGFPLPVVIKNIELDSDFKTNEATINALTVKMLDTDLRASGSIINFTNPLLNIIAEANDLNLASVKEAFPVPFEENGIDINGAASIKIKFEGLAYSPLDGKILATASLSQVNLASSKLNQSIKNITGVVEATPDSLKWRDFTASYLGKQYTLTGALIDFKNPKVTTSLDGDEVQLKMDIAKQDNIVTINQLVGKYLSINFDAKGTATLTEGQQPYLNINSNLSFAVEDIIALLPDDQKKNIAPLKPTGMLDITAALKGNAQDWKNWELNATINSDQVSLLDYKLNNLKVNVIESQQKIKSLTLDGILYGGKVHAVASGDLADEAMPFDLALNIDEVDMKKFKMDSPLKAEEINGKFYLTTIAKGTIADIKNLTAKGSLAIREGFLGEFKLFKGLLSALNEALRLGQLMIHDVDGNFIIENQKISTDNLRMRSPTIVLLGQGWVDFDQMCDLKMFVDLSSGIVPPIAEDVLRSLEVRIYDKISNPKFDKKISVPQVINSIIKTIGIFQ